MLIHLLTHSLTYSLTHSLTCLLTRSLTHSLTHLLTHPLTHSPTHSLAHSLTHSLTHMLNNFVFSKGSMVSPIVSTTNSHLPTTPPQLVHSHPHPYKPVPSSSHPYSSSPITSSSLLASSHGPYAPLPTVDETSRTQAATNFTIPTSHLHFLQSSSSSSHHPVSSGSVLSSFPSIPPAPPPLSEALQTPLLSTYTSPSPPSHHLPLSSHTLKWTPPSIETSSPLAQWAPTQPSSTARPHVNSNLNSHTPQPSSSLPAFTSIAQSILAELAAPLQRTVTSPSTTTNDSALSTATN